MNATRYLMNPEQLLRFMQSVTKSETGCWISSWAKDRGGYPITKLGKHCIRANRLAYMHFIGPLANDKLACHHCDTPACINPEHLFEGTPQQNSTDMVSKKRQANGATHWRTV